MWAEPNFIGQSELDSIFNNNPNYIPKANEVQSEIKSQYTTIREEISIFQTLIVSYWI